MPKNTNKAARRSGEPCEAGPHACPMAGLLETLTRPWTLHILWTLSTHGPTRFGALRRGVEGISSRVLTERLRVLEEKGFLYRDYKPTIPPEVTYGLTKRVKDIHKVLAELGRLAQKWQMEDGPAKQTVAKTATGAATESASSSVQNVQPA
jgi:DNA-binding HxlR family transcriptional regulator